MIVKRLHLARVRAFDHAEFDFTPGMNLLVGVNGVGKTTVLDALRICLSRVLPTVTASRSRPIPFDAADIRGKASALTTRLFFELEGKDFEFLVHKQRERTLSCAVRIWRWPRSRLNGVTRSQRSRRSNSSAPLPASIWIWVCI